MEIYYFSQHGNPKSEELLWHLSDSDFVSLTNCFKIYKRKTGVEFDEYKDTEIPEGNLTPLINSVKEALLNEKNHSVIKALNKFLDILSKAEKENRGIGFYGD